MMISNILHKDINYSNLNSTNRNIIRNVNPKRNFYFKNKNSYSLDKLLLNKQKLNSFLYLNENFNSYNGSKFSEDLLKKTSAILSEIKIQPQIFPTGRGSIQFESYIDDNNFYEIEINENNVFLYLTKDGKELEKEIDFIEIPKYINTFYE